MENLALTRLDSVAPFGCIQHGRLLNLAGSGCSVSTFG
jgi:hypothetical protein